MRFIFILYVLRPAARFLIPHFILFPLFALPFAGAVDKIVLPDGMQSVNFVSCHGLTGTESLGMIDVIFT